MTGTLTRPDVFRQSLLAGFETCARRTMHGLKLGDDIITGWTGTSAELGSAGHAVFAEMLRTMYRFGHDQMPTQEAIEVMYEVLAKGSWVLPLAELDDLRWLVLAFCEFKFKPQRILAVEQRLTLPIECPDGVVRVLKGQPDLISADPPRGLAIDDWKTGRGKPKAPRVQPEGDDVVEGRKYLSERGVFQLDTYGLLALEGLLDDGSQLAPGADYAMLVERHLRSGATRTAKLSRPELEHVRRKIAFRLMQLDQAISEGESSKLWPPRPGSHCTRQCPVAASCPVPREQRGDGALETPAQADEAAHEWALLSARREQLRVQLKAVVDTTGYEPAVNESQVVGWDPPLGKGRKFGIHARVETISEGSK